MNGDPLRIAMVRRACGDFGPLTSNPSQAAAERFGSQAEVVVI
jgi:hypothetical protein